MKYSNGRRSVVAMLSEAQKPLVDVEASPPWATAMQPATESSPNTRARYTSDWAQPVAGVYCVPTPPQAGSRLGPSRFGKLITTPTSRPPDMPSARIMVDASASSADRPSASASGRER